MATTSMTDNPFATPHRERGVTRTLIRSLVLIVGCCAAVYGLHVGSQNWLVSRLSFGLADHPPQVQAERLSMLAEFGERGLPTLVQSVISSNDRLAKSAFGVLVQMQGRWQTGPVSGESLNLAFVEAIGRVAAECPENRRYRLAELLNQTILDTVESSGDKDQQAYAIANSLLAVLTPTGTQANTNIASAIESRIQLSNAQPELINDRDPAQLIKLPSATIVDIPEDYSRTSGAILPPLPTRLLDITKGQKMRAAETSFATTTDPLADSIDRSLSVKVSAPSEPIDSVVENPLSTYDTPSVIKFLGEEQPSLIDAAELELQARGFSVAEFDLAKRLISDDVQVRLAMAAEITSRSDIDPRTWLVWMLSDPVREVRLEAVSLLGTMNEPAISAALRNHLQNERDLIVASRVRKVLGLR